MITAAIVAGDPSGDIHGARLMAALQQRFPDNIRFVGIGGANMEKAGLQSYAALHEMSVVGFWEVAKRYRFFRTLLETARQNILSAKVDLFIPVDYPGFNLRLAASLRKHGIPVYWYIAPQLWAWGSGRAQKLAEATDVLLTVFPFEKPFFEDYGIHTEFVGHPLLEDPAFERTPPNTGRQKLIGLFPGSRRQEIEHHLPIMAKTGELLQEMLPEHSLSTARAPWIPENIYRKFLPATHELHNDSRNLMNIASAGIAKAGTTTLEAALLGLPFSTMYQTSPISYFLGKRLINLPHISLANILAGKTIVQEFIQSAARPELIAKEICALLTQSEKRETMQNEFMQIRHLLGDLKASVEAANIIAQRLGM